MLELGRHAALRPKTTWELFRALGILTTCSSKVFVQNANQVMQASSKILGRKTFRALIKPTFYRQFVGGEHPEELKSCVKQLQDQGVRPLLTTTYEQDVEQDSCSNKVYFKNCAKILECLELAAELDSKEPMMQLKVTGIVPPSLLVKLGQLYDQSENKMAFVDALSNCLVSQNKEIPHLPLEKKERFRLQAGLMRLTEIGQATTRLGVKLLVDAETTDVNSGISALTLALMAIHNTWTPEVWNTYQCYLKSAHETLEQELAFCKQLGLGFGAKVVRGAYLTWEQPQGTLHHSYAQVAQQYDSTVRRLLDLAHLQGPSRCQLILATHNEASILAALNRMKELGLTQGVMFGQLYGMSDQITFVLAGAGYTVYKSIPYGPLETVLPYLARRVAENQSVLEGARRERELLWSELKFRLRGGLLSDTGRPSPLPVASRV